jgi:hypothetical protein
LRKAWTATEQHKEWSHFCQRLVAETGTQEDPQ